MFLSKAPVLEPDAQRNGVCRWSLWEVQVLSVEPSHMRLMLSSNPTGPPRPFHQRGDKAGGTLSPDAGTGGALILDFQLQNCWKETCYL